MRKCLIAAAVIFVADQLAKLAAQHWLALHVPLPVMPGFNLTLTYNPGAAFSFLSEAGGWQRWFFIVITIAVCAVLIAWLRRLPQDDTGSAVGITLILGGALGNLFDRLVHGHVVDFFDVYYEQYHWPIFNIADACVTAGALLIVAIAVFEKKSETAP